MLKKFKVYDENSFIGWYRAKNEKAAIEQAQRDQLKLSVGFRKSFHPINFKAPRAEHIIE